MRARRANTRANAARWLVACEMYPKGFKPGFERARSEPEKKSTVEPFPILLSDGHALSPFFPTSFPSRARRTSRERERA